MKKAPQPITDSASRQAVDLFIEQLNRAPAIIDAGQQGRILFALDATASRQATWDHACHLQSEMFLAAGKIGSLLMQLCYFRGYNEFQSSNWLTDSHKLLNVMNQVHCAAGHTQIHKVLQHALNETRLRKIQAVIYIGDCMEESLDQLCKSAGELGLLNTPVFLFQEGNDPAACKAFKAIARLSGGAYHSFNGHSSDLLKQLLTAVAVYAAGGKKALQHFATDKDAAVTLLLQQLK